MCAHISMLRSMRVTFSIAGFLQISVSIKLIYSRRDFSCAWIFMNVHARLLWRVCRGLHKPIFSPSKSYSKTAVAAHLRLLWRHRQLRIVSFSSFWQRKCAEVPHLHMMVLDMFAHSAVTDDISFVSQRSVSGECDTSVPQSNAVSEICPNGSS